MAVFGVEPPLFEKDPVAGEAVQTAPVAPPPNDPPNAMVVPPWQIAGIAPPAFTVGFGFTVTFLLAVTVPQEPPLVVNANVIGEVDPADAV